MTATKNSKPEHLRKTKLYKTIRKDLSDQLERNGTIGKYYFDLIDDYMDLWLTKVALVEDIQERGVQVETVSASGVPQIKKNESVDLRIKVNAQMLRLLAELGIKPVQAGGEDDAL